MTDYGYRPGTTADGLPLSRRDFLIGSLLTLGGLALSAPSHVTAERTTESELLAVDDLLLPAGGTYVPWRVEDTQSPLFQHLSRTVPGFEQASSEMVGFVGQHVRDAPQYVEAAVVESGDLSIVALVDATTVWLTAIHGKKAVQVERLAEATQWTISADGVADVLRLGAISPGVLSFVAARGPERTLLLPQEAVEQYAATIRKRR